ncbi:unnamed protein product [Rotaria sp. Silwood2]|nr:unnamed protein product [Rotaria sp. Silwood2]CAF2683998.1 unnamed protein product [Rotaria sp. Silwood2]CAF4421244.1 unnamed protein product [Rotaria sp. Silwood2]CAF4460657.1 unnamed protein product [Rotaria sp. Silwood2]
MTNDTRIVACGEYSEGIAIVTARVGNGRCLVFGSKYYVTAFLDNNPEDKRFIENCRRWLSPGKDNAQFESIDEIESMNSVKEKETIIV